MRLKEGLIAVGARVEAEFDPALVSAEGIRGAIAEAWHEVV